MSLDLQLQRLLDRVELVPGPGDPRQGRMCIMSLAAFLAGEANTDSPRSASPAIRAFAIPVNDGMPSHERRRLKPFAPRIVGTNDGLEAARAEILRLALVGEVFPRLTEHFLRALDARHHRSVPGRLWRWLREGERSRQINEILDKLDKTRGPVSGAQLAETTARLIAACGRDASDTAEAEWWWNQAVGLLDELCDVGAEGRSAPEVSADRVRRLEETLAARPDTAARATAGAAMTTASPHGKTAAAKFQR